MSTEAPAPEKAPPKRLFLPSLAIAFFSVSISNTIITLLAVDIAKTFFGSANAAAVGAVSQLSTFNAAAEVVFALLLSILAIRFRHKPLLLVGVIFVVVSAVGSFLAPTLLSLQLFYAMEGIGSIMVYVLAFTLIGDSLPSDKKAKAISYVLSIGMLASLVVVLLVGLTANFGGWRYGFLLVALPASVAGLILASVVLPSKPREKPATGRENPYVRSFKQIFTNRSATACLVASMLSVAGSQIAVFAIAFYRTRFAVPREWTMGIYEVALIMYIVAFLVAGRLVNRFGAKRLWVLSALLAAFFVMTFLFIPNLWIALTFDMLHVWFAATASVAFACLILDQVPKSRGTMMSLNKVFDNIGSVIAPAVGGALLVLTDGVYGAIGLTLGIMTIAGTAILFFFAKDPNRP
ncbi:MFS transporter [Candidatus Bathyarchaeota archaeon]|nr:MFS transporter [Candidatus Bathyarchaeota archaeon]